MKTLRELASTEASRDFSILCRAVVLGKRDVLSVEQARYVNSDLKRIVASRMATMTPDQRRYQKAAVAAGTTLDSTWAAPLADFQNLASSFLASLKNYGCFDRLLPDMRAVPMRTRVGANSIGASAATVAQASAKLISRISVTSGTLDERKAVAILVLTKELMDFSSRTAGTLFIEELSNAVSVETDAGFVALLTSGAPSIVSGGPTAEHTRNDLRIMLGNVTTNARSKLYLLAPSAVAKSLSVLHTNNGARAFENVTYRGGNISGIELVVSDGVPASTMVLVDAQAIAAASEGITIDSSDQASIQMEDTSPDSPVTASTVMRSMWQNDEISLKAERYWSAAKLTTRAVCVATSVGYVGDSPGP
jgi:hypothetical protein